MSASLTQPIRVGARVLVAGGGGYIGAVLVRQLLADGWRVRVLDALFYGADSLADLSRDPDFELIVGDTRDGATVELALRDVDAVVHLAELVGDPACAVDPSVTREINLEATASLAELAKEAGVRRFVYPSSCSVYGASEATVAEESVLNPVSLYAETKIQAEAAVRALADDTFEPVILRLATVFGLSPRPRFDLVVNLLAARGLVDGEVTLFGGGQWRPFIHVADVAAAMRRCLTAPGPIVAGRTYNLGSDELNHRVEDVAHRVLELTPGARLRTVADPDTRDYRVSFRRAAREIGIQSHRSLADGIREIQDALLDGHIADYRDPRYSNVATMRTNIAGFRREVDLPVRSLVG